MVSHYLTIKLIGREHIPHRKTFHTHPCESMSYPVLITVSGGYPKVRGRLLTCYSPVRRSSTPERAFPLDLHVLSTPPAFVLSQDQTLHRNLQPHTTNPHPKAQARQHEEKESHIPRQKTNPDKTNCQNHCQRNHQHHHPPTHPKGIQTDNDVNGAKQTNSSTIKHTVEFSKIRRTHIATLEDRRLRGATGET